MHMNTFALIFRTATEVHALLDPEYEATTSSVSIFISSMVKGRLWGRPIMLFVEESTGKKVSRDR
jgi:hypothetical protein